MKRASHRDLPVYVSQISITALLDLVLVLLLVFIVAVPFLRREKPVVASPAAGTAAPAAMAPKNKIDLRIQPDQSILINGKKVTGERLLPELKKLVVAQPDSGVLVQMPANFAAGSLARLMEEMHRLGVKHTAVEVVDAAKP